VKELASKIGNSNEKVFVSITQKNNKNYYIRGSMRKMPSAYSLSIMCSEIQLSVEFIIHTLEGGYLFMMRTPSSKIAL
jgi:hypothetical protein